MNKSDIINHLRELIVDGNLSNALDLLITHIEELDSSCYNDVLMLKSRFNSGKRDFYPNGIINNEEYGMILSKVTLSLLELINKIEKQKHSCDKPQIGHLMYKIPVEMEVDKEHKCIVRIAYDLEKLTEKLKIDQNTGFENIRVSNLMNVEIMDNSGNENFSIKNCTHHEQFILKQDFTEWIFLVKPLREGHFSLLLKAVIIENINGNNAYKDIVFEKEVKVLNAICNIDNGDSSDSFSIMALYNEKLIKDYTSKHMEKDSSISIGSILFTSEEAFAGSTVGKDGWAVEDIDFFNIPGLTGGGLVAFPIKGNSMEPIISNGDVVICREIQSISEVCDNKIYAIKHNGSIWVKHLQKIMNRNGQVVRLKLISANHLEHDPFTENVNEHTRAYQVIRIISEFD